MEIGLIIYMYKEDKNGKNTLRIPNAETTFANLGVISWPDLTLCENQSEELTVWSCISGIHDLQKTQIHALGRFIKNLRQKRHGGWLPIQVSIVITVYFRKQMMSDENKENGIFVFVSSFICTFLSGVQIFYCSLKFTTLFLVAPIFSFFC